MEGIRVCPTILLFFLIFEMFIVGQPVVSLLTLYPSLSLSLSFIHSKKRQPCFCRLSLLLVVVRRLLWSRMHRVAATTVGCEPKRHGQEKLALRRSGNLLG